MDNLKIAEFGRRYGQFRRSLKWIAKKRNRPGWDESLREKFDMHETEPVDEMWSRMSGEEKDEFLRGEDDGRLDQAA